MVQNNVNDLFYVSKAMFQMRYYFMEVIKINIEILAFFLRWSYFNGWIR